jgi:hypothetical protein
MTSTFVTVHDQVAKISSTLSPDRARAGTGLAQWA